MSKEGKKKGPKKVAKKAPKKVTESNGEATNLVTLATLATEAGVGAATARRKLRDANVERTGRWSWEDGSKGLKEARKALGLAA